MFKALREISERDGKLSSKRFWYNGACLVASIVIIWICYKDTMEDWAFICIYGVYLVTVGGFEVIVDLVNKVIEFKKGGTTNASNTDAPTPGTPASSN